MKLNKREQVGLFTVAFVGIGMLYYQFGYSNLSTKANEKLQAKTEIEQKYNMANDTVNALEAKKSNVKVLTTKINEKSKPLYPTISQEHIVLELDKLLKENGLEGGMTFDVTEVKGIEVIKKSEKDKDLGKGSVQKIVDEFNSKYGAGKTSPESSTNNTSSTTTNTPSEETTVTQLKVIVDFNGTYESVNKFLNAIGNYERKISILMMSLSEKSLEEVKGSVGMVIYSVPKINDDLNTYSKWNLNDVYGKFRPFSTGSLSGTGIKSEVAKDDFLINVNSSKSVLSTLIIGKSDDKLRSTYAYADGNNVQEAEIVLTEKDGKYYYKYKAATDTIPMNYTGLGNEFVVSGDNIVLNISSEKRVDPNDESGLKLKIINDTNKLVRVDITGDDEKDPRVSIDGDSKNISVNKK
ncbi:pilus assembly protein PilO [Clostridium sp. SHJSY1]|uniref:pilus assembly protein PilO n=1 Tax=Clostridium sp. SHJSY1 TaxID=2942483 RepID=UPI0028741D9D|nr:pilus assembly protein PilO [Clostridium sp. SHJSY1]MDS0525687.1 pilus assembly protein PilO [Clostridium sp. SHJSY1]